MFEGLGLFKCLLTAYNDKVLTSFKIYIFAYDVFIEVYYMMQSMVPSNHLLKSIFLYLFYITMVYVVDGTFSLGICIMNKVFDMCRVHPPTKFMYHGSTQRDSKIPPKMDTLACFHPSLREEFSPEN